MSFDPYAEWLDLPDGDRPPDPFVLLAIDPTNDCRRIEDAADRQIQRVRDHAPWSRQREMRTTLSQILRARNLLLDSARRAELPQTAAIDSQSAREETSVHFSEFVPENDVEISDNGNPSEFDETLQSNSVIVPVPTAGEIISLEHLPGGTETEPLTTPPTRDAIESRPPLTASRSPSTSADLRKPSARRKGKTRRRNLPRKDAPPSASNATSNARSNASGISSAEPTSDSTAAKRSLPQRIGILCGVLAVALCGWFVADEFAVSPVEHDEVAVTSTDSSKAAHAIELPQDVRDTDRSPVLVVLPGPATVDEPLKQNDPPVAAPVAIAAPEFPKSNVDPVNLPDAPTVAAADSSPTNSSSAPQTTGGPQPTEPTPTIIPTPLDPATKQYAALVRQILAMGFDKNHTASSGLDSLLTQAAQLKSDDARAEFAAGLAHWKRLRYDDARTSFAKAAQRDPHYRFAWQAEIQILLKRQQFDEAFARLQIAATDAASDGNSHRATASAVWLGRVVGFLTHPRNDLFKDADKVAELDAKLQESISPQILSAYGDGKKAVQAEVAEQAKLLRSQLAELAKEDSKRRVDDQKKIDKEQQRLGTESADVKQTAEQWKKWIDMQLKEHDQELEKLSRSFTNLSTQAQSVSTSITLINNQIVTIELQSTTAGENGLPVASQPLQQLIVRRNQLVTDIGVLETRSQSIRQQATTRLTQRQADIEKYRKATGKLVAKKDSLSKWQSILDRQEKQTQDSETANSGRSRSLRRRLYALDTYVPFDLNLEKSRLEKELAIED